MIKKDLKPVEHFIETRDGWRLAAYRYQRKTRRTPIILIHGMGSNRYNVDFPDQRISLAKYLYRKGFDVWVLELRGAGKSQPSSMLKRIQRLIRPSWTFDDHVFIDIPTFVDHIQKETGQKSFHWIGHSLGGSVIFAAVSSMGNKICQSAVTIASAMNSHTKPGFAQILVKIEDSILRCVPLIPGKYLSSITFPAIGLFAPLFDNLYYCLDNIDKKTLRTVGRIAVENISIPLFLQMHRWYQENHFDTLDRSFSYHKSLQSIKAPWLVLAGSADGMTQLPDVFYGYDQIRSKKKKFIIFGKEFGYKSDYGHLDLVLGKNAPEEVYPQVLNWVKSHDPALIKKNPAN
jgi:pimeloyl-ACP methyl ester carboxylesterase